MTRLGRSLRAGVATTIVVALGAVGFSAGFASIDAKPLSRFDHNTEHWTVVGDPVSQTPQHLKRGGNPTGFIRTTDSGEGGIMYWDAPTKFLGNQGASYGGTLRFDLRETTAGRPFDAPDVILKGAGYRLTYSSAKEPAGHWIRFKVPLSQSGWLDHGVAATEAQMRAVLAAVGTLLIRAEYTSHVDVDDLDNVVIKAP